MEVIFFVLVVFGAVYATAVVAGVVAAVVTEAAAWVVVFGTAIARGLRAGWRGDATTPPPPAWPW